MQRPTFFGGGGDYFEGGGLNNLHFKKENLPSYRRGRPGLFPYGSRSLSLRPGERGEGRGGAQNLIGKGPAGAGQKNKLG